MLGEAYRGFGPQGVNCCDAVAARDGKQQIRVAAHDIYGVRSLYTGYVHERARD